MKQTDKDIEISTMLVDWYKENQRDLPWRQTTDPYKIWISEIILQQTRVVQGLDYYYRFIDRFPTVDALAAASEEEVLKYWQGLGYYSRARNLHASAQYIMLHCGGIFPSSYETILSLKGIGEYTAAAIASFAWNMPYPVVDGNVYRVFSRLFALDTPIDTGKGKKEFYELANMLINPSNASMHNQAVMDFGALVCTPQAPSCTSCPFQHKCLAFAGGNVLDYPVKQHKTKSRNRYFNYFHIEWNDRTFLSRRDKSDIWKGLYEFPLIEIGQSVNFTELSSLPDFKAIFGFQTPLDIMLVLHEKKHVLSHQVIYANFYKVRISNKDSALDKFIEINSSELDNYAISRLTHIYFDKLAESFAN